VATTSDLHGLKDSVRSYWFIHLVMDKIPGLCEVSDLGNFHLKHRVVVDSN
jgi:hypothetical protein